MDVVLVSPEIAGNTGNIIRLCANTGVRLHLVRPLGFVLDDARMRRAGLDYHEFAEMIVHDSWDDLCTYLHDRPMFAFSARARTRYDSVAFGPDSVFVFGTERCGLSAEVLAAFDEASTLQLPMRPNNRSLNLANTVAVVVFEAWRQQGFPGAVDPSAPADVVD
jgi:tRNA (cytidine/uridine-2'-O-)-methyltransferase